MKDGRQAWARPSWVAVVCTGLLAGSTGTTGADEPEPPLHSRSALPFAEDTPDQWMPPRFGQMEQMPNGRARAGDPFPQYKKYRDLREMEAVPEKEKGKYAPYCTRITGPYQREMEGFLKLKPVDGKQTPTDCAAIQNFQYKYRISPRTGYAGPHTWGMARLEQARAHPNPGGKCSVREGRRVACLDLTRQLMWVQNGKKVVFGPALIRSGKPGYETRMGTYSVYWRNEEHTSTLYDAPMPFAQFFSGGQAFHGRYRTIHYEPGSHGCVNLSYRDAERLWKTLRRGDTVHIFGRKPAARKP